MKTGTIAGGIGTSTTIQLSYCPEKIRFITTAAPTSLKVNVLGVGVICDLDANGIISFGKLNKIGTVLNGYEITLADGLIVGKNVEIIVTNGTAAAFDLYVDSNNVGGLGFVQSLRQTVFASTVFELNKFAVFGLGNIAASDQLDITWVDGTVQKVEPAELPFLVQNYQNDTSVKAIFNFDFEIKSVRFIPSSNEVVYIMSYLFTDAAKAFKITK